MKKVALTFAWLVNVCVAQVDSGVAQVDCGAVQTNCSTAQAGYCTEQARQPNLQAQRQPITLEYVNFSRIEKAAKKYAGMQSKARWIRNIKCVAIGAGCAGLAALVFKHYFKADNDKAKGNGAEDKRPVAQMSAEERAAIDARWKECKIKRAEQDLNDRRLGLGGKIKGKIKSGAVDAVTLVACTVLVSLLWKIINDGGSSLGEFFTTVDPQDSGVYKEKNENINVLIQRICLFLIQKKRAVGGKADAASEYKVSPKFLNLILTDILIDHTSLIRWFEDLVGFIKCAITLSAGCDSIELACFEKDVATLSVMLNQFTDKISIVINSHDAQNQEGLQERLIDDSVESFLSFCNQFSKFIYDSGLYLYENDFLQK